MYGIVHTQVHGTAVTKGAGVDKVKRTVLRSITAVHCTPQAFTCFTCSRLCPSVYGLPDALCATACYSIRIPSRSPPEYSGSSPGK